MFDPLVVLVLSVVITIFVSSCCSLMEAALYAVPVAHVRHLMEGGSRAGELLSEFKEDMGRPISAILILNTIANTGGASIAGWAGGQVFSQSVAVVFSVCFVLAILYCSEIIPKTIGVLYCRPIAETVARPLAVITKILSPFIAFSQFVGQKFGGKEKAIQVSQEEVLSMADIGTEEGALDRLEGSVIKNIIGLDQLLVRDVLTPRVVVFRLEKNRTIGDVREDITNWNFSRVPLFDENEPDHITHYVTQRDIYREILRNELSKKLIDIARPLKVTPELIRVDKLLLQMFEEREHICAVVDEHGGFAGIITLEDIIEEVVGREIVDEYDTVSDLRTFARVLRVVRGRKKT
ncbi:MAG: HlyC/CorC family transporter [Bdellovibrionales bacterium]|nr:HlyC/CorC family transporter [Bdellovibrionales bacterium]